MRSSSTAKTRTSRCGREEEFLKFNCRKKKQKKKPQGFGGLDFKEMILGNLRAAPEEKVKT